MAEEKLHEKLTIGTTFLGSEDFYKQKAPEYIFKNLKDGYGQRAYQKEAFGRFVYYWEDYPNRPRGAPTQILYHMATGSGKTLIMAGLMIYLYEQGYRNFMFFVNSTNVIDKTRENFLNPVSQKYLFANTVQIEDKQIRIKEVDNFSAANQDDINIVFSTIQGLHIRLNTPQENTITYEDFSNDKIVLISDEAHHINAETKNGKYLSKTELFEVTSWEQTVTKVFKAHPENTLLEFTATADLNHPDIEKKYKNTIIYDYPLKEFRKDGYSKEVKVLQADLNDFKRSLQAVILSQFRLKLFAKYGHFIKPVILFKSRTIKESEDFYHNFIKRMKNLSANDLKNVYNNSNLDPVLQRTYRYFKENGITLPNLAAELRVDFSPDKCLSVNSQSESEEKQIAVNSLEDENNAYRAIFVVDKLNEGWDVLNLFDIVRLYDTRDAKAGKPGKTTISEAQLIGRGARYCPFQFNADQSPYMRKFDYDLENPMRICEELYYHSTYNPRYIDELHTALEEIGIKAKETKEIELKIKESFKQNPFYKKGLIFINEKRKYDRMDVFGLPSALIDYTYKVALRTGYTKISVAFVQQAESNIEKKQKDYHLISFGVPIIRKAINKLDFFHFSNLNRYLPNLNSISEFIISNDYLGKIKVEIEGTDEQVENLLPDEKLDVTIKVLEDIAKVVASDNVEYKGTKEFKPYLLKDKVKDKKLNITISGNTDKEYGVAQSETTNENLRIDLSKKDWYVFEDNYGTTEEKFLVKFINKTYNKLKTKYSDIYLIRNERHFKIYNYDDGQALEPDFLLLLIDRTKKRLLHYQVFVEPKGEHLFERDRWKEEFLIKLREDHRIEQIWENKQYIIWGMPFYNEEYRKKIFETEFDKLFR